jgi:hypothetical protein
VHISTGQKLTRCRTCQHFWLCLPRKPYQSAACCCLPQRTQITHKSKRVAIANISQSDKYAFEPVSCSFCGKTTLFCLSHSIGHAMTSLNLITQDSSISPTIDDANNPRKRQRTACDRCKSRKQKVGQTRYTYFARCHSYVLDSVTMHIHNAPTAQRLARTATNRQRWRT